MGYILIRRWGVVMEDKFILKRVDELCYQRGWSHYKLAQESGVPGSTIHNMFNRTTMPTFNTIEKFCLSFGITMTQFFSISNERIDLTEAQAELLDLWDSFDEKQKELALVYLRGLANR